MVGPSVLRDRRAALVRSVLVTALIFVSAGGASAIQVPDSVPNPPAPVPDVQTTKAAEALVPDSAAPSPLAETRRLLGAAMPVTASRILARGLSSGEMAGPDAILLTARAYAEYRSWPAVRRLLLDQPWLSEWEDAAGQRLLAEAYVGLDSLDRAAAAYLSYLEAGSLAQPPPVAVRVGYAQTLTRLGHPVAAAAQFEQAASEYPALGSWLELSALYRRAEAGDADGTGTLAARLEGDPLVPADSVGEAMARLAFEIGDPAEGVRLARQTGTGVWNRLAGTHIAPHLRAVGDERGAEEAYRAALKSRRPAPDVGPALLERDSSWQALRDVGASDLRAGRSERGRRYLADALRIAPESEAAAIAEQLAGAHRSAGDHERAIAELGPWLGGRALSAGRRGSVWLLAARTFGALGESLAAREAFETAASGAGVSAALASYLLADGDHDAGRLDEAAARYASTADRFPGTTYGARSLSRLAMLDYLEGRYEEARTRLELYRRRYPRGSWYQGAVYWTARTHEAEGDTATARALFLETIGYDPLDYYAILAEERTERDRWSALRLQPDRTLPELDPGFRATLDRMRLLRELGWKARARRELEAARRTGPTNPDQLLVLALELSEQGWTQEGVRLAWRVKARRERWSEALLRAVYPLPFREALIDAARDRGLAPQLVAGLARRESLFDPEIVSAANAVGLMQTLPRTARDVARRAGLPEYRRSQLTVPQVNLLLGTRYLSDILDRFGGSRLAGLVSYNAGPHRWLAWREFPELAAGEDLFVERIPFRETREYVRAVTELIAIYDRLYGPWGGLDAP
jgi:soluble lytic murein transglycosylase